MAAGDNSDNPLSVPQKPGRHRGGQAAGNTTDYEQEILLVFSYTGLLGQPAQPVGRVCPLAPSGSSGVGLRPAVRPLGRSRGAVGRTARPRSPPLTCGLRPCRPPAPTVSNCRSGRGTPAAIGSGRLCKAPSDWAARLRNSQSSRQAGGAHAASPAPPVGGSRRALIGGAGAGARGTVWRRDGFGWIPGFTGIYRDRVPRTCVPGRRARIPGPRSAPAARAVRGGPGGAGEGVVPD